MGALQAADVLVVAAQHRRRRRQQLEVLGLQRLASARERVEAFARMPRRAYAARPAFEFGRHHPLVSRHGPQRVPACPSGVIVRRGVFHDSVSLMLATRDALSQPGVLAGAVLPATPLNLELLAAQGFDLARRTVRGRTTSSSRYGPSGRRSAPRWPPLRQARARGRAPSPPACGPARPLLSRRRTATPGLNVALVSVPGPHAAGECDRRLEAGLHVFCFSDGGPLEHEVELKRRRAERGLLLMGPECGTAILDGAGLGFANVVERGPVGIVGASGTGIQALCCLLDAAGVGISQAIGVGGRDLHAEVGGAMPARARAARRRSRHRGDRRRWASAAPAVRAAFAGGGAGSGKPLVAAFRGRRPLDRAARPRTLSAGRGRRAPASSGRPARASRPGADTPRPLQRRHALRRGGRDRARRGRAPSIPRAPGGALGLRPRRRGTCSWTSAPTPLTRAARTR